MYAGRFVEVGNRRRRSTITPAHPYTRGPAELVPTGSRAHAANPGGTAFRRAPASFPPRLPVRAALPATRAMPAARSTCAFSRPPREAEFGLTTRDCLPLRLSGARRPEPGEPELTGRPRQYDHHAGACVDPPRAGDRWCLRPSRSLRRTSGSRAGHDVTHPPPPFATSRSGSTAARGRGTRRRERFGEVDGPARMLAGHERPTRGRILLDKVEVEPSSRGTFRHYKRERPDGVPGPVRLAQPGPYRSLPPRATGSAAPEARAERSLERRARAAPRPGASPPRPSSTSEATRTSSPAASASASRSPAPLQPRRESFSPTSRSRRLTCRSGSMLDLLARPPPRASTWRSSTSPTTSRRRATSRTRRSSCTRATSSSAVPSEELTQHPRRIPTPSCSSSRRLIPQRSSYWFRGTWRPRPARGRECACAQCRLPVQPSLPLCRRAVSRAEPAACTDRRAARSGLLASRPGSPGPAGRRSGREG